MIQKGYNANIASLYILSKAAVSHLWKYWNF